MLNAGLPVASATWSFAGSNRRCASTPSRSWPPPSRTRARLNTSPTMWDAIGGLSASATPVVVGGALDVSVGLADQPPTHIAAASATPSSLMATALVVAHSSAIQGFPRGATGPRVTSAHRPQPRPPSLLKPASGTGYAARMPQGVHQ